MLNSYNMEFKIDISCEQILSLVRQLPYKYKKKLAQEIEKDLRAEDEELNELQRFLLQGPVMSDEQFDEFKKLRKG